MMTKPLTLVQLNRATLARQLLLRREKATPLRAVERLLGLQAQLARPPFVALWSRLSGFDRGGLIRALQRNNLVRATTMRATLHLHSAKDYLRFRPVLQPMLSRGMQSTLRARADELDIEALVETARQFFDEQPRPFNALRDHLKRLHPTGDERAMGYAVRTHLPLLQLATDDRWGFPATADFAPAESWLGKELGTDDAPHALVTRYLAAFGPATPADAQTWSGLTGLNAVIDELRPKLRVLRDEAGRELFDVRDGLRPPASAKAPARFLPDFDSVVLALSDRRRLIDDAHRPKVCLKNLRVLPTFLVDGRVAGTWKIERSKRTAKLVVEPFDGVSAKARKDLRAEGEALLRFVEPDAETFEVRA